MAEGCSPSTTVPVTVAPACQPGASTTSAITSTVRLSSEIIGFNSLITVSTVLGEVGVDKRIFRPVLSTAPMRSGKGKWARKRCEETICTIGSPTRT